MGVRHPECQYEVTVKGSNSCGALLHTVPRTFGSQDLTKAEPSVVPRNFVPQDLTDGSPSVPRTFQFLVAYLIFIAKARKQCIKGFKRA